MTGVQTCALPISAVLIIVAVVVILLVVVIGAVIGMYNSLVKLNIKTDESWSGISVQLKRRADLIPNIVETVKGYAAHESGVFEKVTEARSAIMSATHPAEAAKADGELTMALKSLFAVSENYPELKASRSRTCSATTRREAERSEERRVGKECRSRWSPYH